MAKVNYPIYIPVRVSFEDALVLETAARAQQTSRSALMRNLIRSLASSSNSGVSEVA